jgi:ATP-dependent helicase HrpB
VSINPLPVDPYLPAIIEAVRSHSITLVDAPPGTGKTTRVAPALLDGLVSAGKKIYLLQPRRLAARSVAARIAWEKGEAIGNTVGYSVRLDHQVGRNTRLIVATEGILIRRMQEDPAIEDVSVVILDEFHERSLDSDLLFAMLRRVQQTLRDDLKMILMSATLDPSLMAGPLANAPVIRVNSIQYPVAIRYCPPRLQSFAGTTQMVEHMAETLTELAPNRPGDILAFLPGSGEIHRCRDLLGRQRIEGTHDVLPLYGSMPLDEQVRAIEPGPRPRVVLATNIAETSLTILGIQTVVDSGLARVLRFSPDVGLDRLALENISSASAIQRAGRAGRVAPGSCVRLWSEASDRSRAPFLEPEIRRIDLAGAVLQLFAWGEGSSRDFPWLEPPREDSFRSAVRLLESLGAIEAGRITPLGTQLARLPLHPRLGRMVLESVQRGCLVEASWIAAILSERDPFERRARDSASGHRMTTMATKRWDSDCVERIHVLRGRDRTPTEQTPFGIVNRSAVRAIEQSARQIQQIGESIQRRLTPENRTVSRETQESPASNERVSAEAQDFAILRSILVGFPDRVARRRAAGRQHALMVGGKGVQLDPQSGVIEPELFVCVETVSGPGDAVVRQASRVDAAWLVGSNRRECDELFFHPSQKQVVARRRTYWIDLMLRETPTSIDDEEACAQVLFEAVRTHWDTTFPKDDLDVQQWLHRAACLREWMPELELPMFETERLHEVAKEMCRGKRSLEEVKRGPWLDWLRGQLTSNQLASLEREAPARIQVPSGSSIRIEYALGKSPILAVKIQEVFSWQQTPRIASGRIPLLLHLLAPSMRPQQITDDLASFWHVGYAEVRKELKRRYPKHSWPEDPWRAQASKR